MTPLTLECAVQVKRRGKGGRKVIRPAKVRPDGKVPRISRLMALAIKFDRLVRSGAVKDYAELAWLGGVSRARVTQIMNLLLLAPDIQEALLFMPNVERGKAGVTLRDLMFVVAMVGWKRQRRRWNSVR